MEVSQLIESLDSLWFFSNPFMPFSSDKNTQNKEEPQKPMSPIVKNNQNESPTAQPVNPRCFMCGELVPHLQPLTGTQEVGSQKPTKKEKRSRRRRMRRSKRKILGELDLDLEYCGLLLDSDDEDNTSVSRYQVKLPSFMDLDDTTAMKEHLKSWACAVACTVR